MKFFHYLIVIHSNGTELLIQGSEFGDIFERGTVGSDYPKFFGKDTGGNKLRLGLETGLLEKCEETGMFHRIEIDGVAKTAGLVLGFLPPFFREGRRLFSFSSFITLGFLVVQ